jgi:hypothetical protein
LNTKQKIGQKRKRGRMKRYSNERIRWGGGKVVIVIAVVIVLYVLMLFSDSNQGATSLRDEVNLSTFKNTERLLAARGAYTNNDDSIKVTISLNGLTNTIEE